MRNKVKAKSYISRARIARVLGKLAPKIRAFGAGNPGLVLAGGVVRDAVMGRASKDVDITVEKGAAMAAGRKFADKSGGALVVLGKERLARVHVGDAVVDFTPLRARTLDGDLKLRDFTVNALAVRLPWGSRVEVLDPTGGLADIRSRVVRACGPRSFRDDPVRLWRAHRVAAQLGFRLEPSTRRLLRAESRLARRCTAERLRDELFRLLSLPNATAALRAALESGVLLATFPELVPLRRVPAHGSGAMDVLAHTLEALGHLERTVRGLAAAFPREAVEARKHLAEEPVKGRSRLALLKFAVLLHDISKPETYSSGEKGVVHFYGHETGGAARAETLMRRRLRLGWDEIAIVKRVITTHLRLGHLAVAGEFSDRAVFRLLKATGSEFIENLLHAHADRLATHHHKAAPARDVHRTVSRVLALRRKIASRVPRKRLLTGHDIMAEFRLKPGPLVGELLKAVEEAVALGDARTRGEALQAAKKHLQKHRQETGPENGPGHAST